MKELQRKQKFRHIIYSIPSLLVLFAIALLLAKGALGVVSKEKESSERLRYLEEKENSLSLREQELRKGVARLQTEEGIENEIKEKFSVTQEGEYVAVIVDDRRISSSTDELRLVWYKRFWSFITGDR